MVEKYEISEIGKHLKTCYDLFLGSSSFEDRCFAVINSVEASLFNNAIIFHMHEYEEYISKNTAIFKEKLKDNSLFIELFHSDPIISTDKMLHAFKEVSEKETIESILIDISTFTHETLLILIRIINENFKNAEVTFLYTNAADYDTESPKEEKWLSKGIEEIRTVLGYPGNILPFEKTHLIVIVGYEYERATSIINAIEPVSLSLGFGRSDSSTTPDKSWGAKNRFDMLVEDMHTAYSSENIGSFEVPCNNPFDTRNEIKKQVEGIQDKNIVIVTLK